MNSSHKIFNKYIFLIVIVIASENLMSTPLQNISIGLSLLVIALNTSILFYFLFFDKEIRLPFVRFLLVLLFLIPLFGAYRANITYGQPFLRGISTNIQFYGFTATIYVFYCIRKGVFSFKWFERAILLLGAFSLIFLALFKIVFPDFEFTISSWTGDRTHTLKGYQMSSTFILWSAMIYLARFKLSDRSRWLLLSAAFFSYDLIFFNGRSFLLWLSITAMFLLAFDFRGVTRIKVLAFLGLLIFAFSTLTLFSSDFVLATTKKLDLFSNITSFLADNKSSFSLEWRIFQLDQIRPLIHEFMFLGSGFLAPEVTLEIFSYLQPSDLGIIGIVFNYGIIGLVIFLLLGSVIVWYIIKVKDYPNALVLGSCYLLFFRVLSTVTTGSLVYRSGESFILLGIALGLYDRLYNNLSKAKKM